MAADYRVDREVRKYFDQMTAAQHLCGAYGHRWPELNPAKGTIPKGMHVGPIQRDGQFEVTEHCLRGCGKERRSVTLAEGFFDLGTQLRYKNGPDWVTIPREVRNRTLVSQRVHRADLQEQARDVIVAAAKRAAEAARQAEARVTGEKPATDRKAS
jgi:hypothetical protein